MKASGVSDEVGTAANAVDDGAVAAGPRTTAGSRGVVHFAALAAIMAVVLGLRLGGLSDKGLTYWDEGQQALESIFMLNVPSMLPDVVRPYGIGEIPLYFPGEPLIFGRPTYDLFLALSMALFGQQDVSLLGVSACAGILTVLAVYLIARNMFSPGVGLLSAGVLALLPYHVFYSRDGRADGAAALFTVVGLWAYYKCWTVGRNELRWRLLTGLALGIGFTVQNRLYVLVLVLIAQELGSLLVVRRGLTRGKWLLEGATMIAGGLAPVLVWESLYRLLLLYGVLQGQLTLPFKLYSDQLFTSVRRVGGIGRTSPIDVSDLAFYPLSFAQLGSGVVLGLVVLGTLVLLVSRRRPYAGLLVAAQFWIVAAYWTLMLPKAPRFLGVILPAAAILAGYGLCWLWSRGKTTKWPRAVAAVLVIAALLEGVGGWSQSYATSGTGDAVHWLTDRGATRILSAQRPSAQFYAGASALVRDPGPTLEDLSRQHKDGFQYILVDDQAFLFEFTPLADIARDIERSVAPAYAVRDYAKDSPMLYLEHAEWLRRSGTEMKALWSRVRQERGQSSIRVYDVGQYLASKGLEP